MTAQLHPFYLQRRYERKQDEPEIKQHGITYSYVLRLFISLQLVTHPSYLLAAVSQNTRNAKLYEVTLALVKFST